MLVVSVIICLSVFVAVIMLCLSVSLCLSPARSLLTETLMEMSSAKASPISLLWHLLSARKSLPHQL